MSCVLPHAESVPQRPDWLAGVGFELPRGGIGAGMSAIRTHPETAAPRPDCLGMAESKSAALPLGDAPPERLKSRQFRACDLGHTLAAIFRIKVKLAETETTWETPQREWLESPRYVVAASDLHDQVRACSAHLGIQPASSSDTYASISARC